MVPPNVIIFGETGAGKSSIINLLAGANVAAISSGSVGCTFRSNVHNVSIDDMTFKFHDTAGLDEGQGGKVVQQEAIVQLYKLLRGLNDGVSLLIFCMRGPRIKDSCVRNWQLFWNIICQRQVPILLAVTGLENEEDMDAWWEKNQPFFMENFMLPTSVVCITATKGKKRRDGSHNFDYEYAESQRKTMKAVKTIYRRQAWKVEQTEWFTTIVKTSQESGKGGVKEIKNNETVFNSAATELIKQNLMKKEYAEELAQLLKDK